MEQVSGPTPPVVNCCCASLIGVEFNNATDMTTAVMLESAKFGKGCDTADRRGGGRSSTKYKYVCLDPDCDWFLTAGLVGRSGPYSTTKNLSYVVNEQVGFHFSHCKSTPKMLTQHVEKVDAVANIVASNPSVSGKALRDHARSVGTNLDNMSSSSLYRLRKRMLTTSQNPSYSDYKNLPRLLDAFCTINKGSTAALQLDSCGRFFRMFICPSAAVEVASKALNLSSFHCGRHAFINTNIIIWWRPHPVSRERRQSRKHTPSGGFHTKGEHLQYGLVCWNVTVCRIANW